MKNNRPYQKELPDKLYFKIGEVGKIAELPTYVLRFWETEFSRIKPKRTSSGQRLYSKNDVELILRIKHLLHDKKYTIQGTRQYLKSKTPEEESSSSSNILDDIRSELKSIRDLLA